MTSPVLVVGSVALDTVETPFGRRDAILGGAATHFSLSAHHFVPVRLVGVVGRDFPADFTEKFRARGIDIEGLQVQDGRTFRWHGRYEGTMDCAETVGIELNVFGAFRPAVPPRFRDSRFVHLGTADPEAQAHVLGQIAAPEFVMLDTIEFWIRQKREPIFRLLPRVHALCVNHEEALLLSEETNLARAVRRLTAAGLRTLIVKRAEHGATVMTREFQFSVPAFPTEDVVDPTGAGDAFAGGVLGFLAANGAGADQIRRALVYGSVMGSFAVEGFGTEGLDRARREDIEKRAASLLRMMTP